MELLLIILVLLFLFGGGGWYAHRSYGMPGVGGLLGLVVVVLLIAWAFGGLGSLPR